MKRYFVFLALFFGVVYVNSSFTLEDSTPPVTIPVTSIQSFVTTTEAPATTTTTTMLEVSSSPKQAKRCPKFEALFEQYGLVPVETFSYIAWRESRCRVKAINATWDENGNLTYHLNRDKSWDSGLLQINSSWRTVVAKICGSKLGDLTVLHDLDCNLRVAKYLFDNGGLAHWGL